MAVDPATIMAIIQGVASIDQMMRGDKVPPPNMAGFPQLPTSEAPDASPSPFPGGALFPARADTTPLQSGLQGLLINAQPRDLTIPEGIVPTGETQGEQRLNALESILVKGPPRKGQFTDPDELKIEADKREVGKLDDIGASGIKVAGKKLLTNPETLVALARLAQGPQLQPTPLSPMNTRSTFRPADANPFEIIQALVEARRRR